MENLSNYSSTELLKLINDINNKHEILKKELIDHSHEIDELEKLINEKINIVNIKLNVLTELEKKYVLLIEEMSKR